MHILMLSHNVAFKGGGAFFRALQLGKQLARRGHSVTVMASAPGAVAHFQERDAQGVRLVEAPGLMPLRWRYGYDYYETLRRVVWVWKRSFDIVHAFDCRPVVIYPALAAQRHGAKAVLDWCDWFGRGGSVEQRTNPVLRALLRPVETYYEEGFRMRADATTVISSALEQRARNLGVAPDSLLRLPNGADLEAIQPLDRDTARAAMGLPPRVPLIGHVGSLFAADADLLVQAFARVRAARPEARLILVGQPRFCVPGDGVLWTGFVSYADLNHYLAACDVLCLPLADTLANQGRWPSKIADYFAAGRPTVACAVGDVARLVEEADAGLLAEPTPTSLAEKLLALLQDSDLRTRLGRNARRAAETQLDWAMLAGRVEKLYLELN